MTTPYRKTRTGAPTGFFACEAAGLRWLAEAGGAPVVEVLGVSESGLDLVRLVAGSPSQEAARQLGAGLARTHAAGAPAFGSPPPGWQGDGFFGPLDDPYPLPAGAHRTWGEFQAERRVVQVRELLGRQGVLDASLAAGLDRLAARLHDRTWDDDEPPSRLHGDLWSGNVVWTSAGAVLIDPAAHGGHRLTDLAMLDLFGLPHLGDLVDAYDEAWPLPDGWRDVVGLHQVYPVGMHAVLFGGAYLGSLATLVARYT